MKLQFLGTGTSHGIPVIGCSCPVCVSDDPRNMRFRSSLLVCHEGFSVLIDAGPDLRQQCLASCMTSLDAVFFTHWHMDHIGGIDDLRQFNTLTGGRSLPCYGSTETIAHIARRYDYIFTDTQEGGGKPKIAFVEVRDFEPFSAGPLSVTPFPVSHGILRITGFLFGSWAYITDASAIPQETMELLKGLDLLVINALRREPHSTHFSLDEALDIVEKLAPKQAYFTHICHRLHHAETEKTLPHHVRLAYDGLVVQA